MFLAVKTLCLLLIVSAFVICPCYKKRKRTQKQRRIAPPVYEPPQQAHLLYEPAGQGRPATQSTANHSVAVPEPEWSEQSEPSTARPISAVEEATSISVQSEPSTARPISAVEAATTTSGSSSSISTAKQIGENDQDARGDPTEQQPAAEEGTTDSKAGRADYDTYCAIL